MPRPVQDAALEHHPNGGGSWEESRGTLVGQRGKDDFGGQWGPGNALKAKTSRPWQKTIFGGER